MITKIGNLRISNIRMCLWYRLCEIFGIWLCIFSSEYYWLCFMSSAVCIEQDINPLRAIFFRRSLNICLHFMSFHLNDMTQVVKIRPQERQGLYIVSIMGADVLAMQGARASETVIFTVLNGLMRSLQVKKVKLFPRMVLSLDSFYRLRNSLWYTKPAILNPI